MILDTIALSAFGDEDPGIETALSEAEFLALPVIALGEYRYGIAQSRYRKKYEAWLNDVLAELPGYRDHGTDNQVLCWRAE